MYTSGTIFLVFYIFGIAQEISLCDKCDGILVIQSLGGGTGAGLGTYLTRTFREEFPELPLWNTVVWPYTSGEVVVQYFNCLLTLATLAEVSHIMFSFPVFWRIVSANSDWFTAQLT